MPEIYDQLQQFTQGSIKPFCSELPQAENCCHNNDTGHIESYQLKEH